MIWYTVRFQDGGCLDLRIRNTLLPQFVKGRARLRALEFLFSMWHVGQQVRGILPTAWVLLGLSALNPQPTPNLYIRGCRPKGTCFQTADLRSEG